MMDDDRKTYAVARHADGSYAILVRQYDFLLGEIPGFPTLDAALDERARMDAREERRSPTRPRHSDEQRTGRSRERHGPRQADLGKLAKILNEIDAPAAPHRIVPPETVEERPSEPEAPTDPNLSKAE